MSDVILAKIRYLIRGLPETLGLCSSPYFGDASGLAGGVWFPALDPDISVNVSVATEHDGGSPQDTFGNIRIVEFGDGSLQYRLDRLLRAVVAGQPIEVRRGTDDQDWDDMEVWCRTEGDQRSFSGNVMTLTQRSRFFSLAKTVNKSVFTEAENRAVLGRTVPNVIGEVFQVGPFEIDPSQLALYIAENVNFSPETMVAKEGGNPIDEDDIFVAFPIVALKKNPTLPVLFDVIGDNSPDINNAVSGETLYPMSTTDGTNPDGFTVDQTGATISYLTGDVLSVALDATSGAASTGFIPLAVSQIVNSSQYAPWTLTQGSGATSASGSAILNGTGVGPYTRASARFKTIADSPALPTTGRWRITDVDFTLDSAGLQNESLFVLTDTKGKLVETASVPDGTAVAVNRSVSMDYVDASALAGTDLIFEWEAADLDSSSVDISAVSFDLEPESLDEAAIYSNTGILTVDQSALVRVNVESISGRGYISIGSASSVGGEITEHAQVSTSGVSSRAILPTGAYLAIKFVPTGTTTTTFKLKWVAVGDATTITGKLALTVAWLLERAIEVRPSDNTAEARNIAFNSLIRLGTDTENPSLGWYVAGGETVEEMIDLLVRDSACGIWVKDYDGTLRFALWRWLPETTNSDPLILIDDHKIESTSLRTYVPRTVTRRVVGGKNVVPLQRDQAAGITETFTQSDRAQLFEEYRHWKSGSAVHSNVTGTYDRWPRGEGE